MCKISLSSFVNEIVILPTAADPYRELVNTADTPMLVSWAFDALGNYYGVHDAPRSILIALMWYHMTGDI